MNTRCYIVGAGDYCDGFLPESCDFVIAADNGYTELINRGITPDLVVGDFDSLVDIPPHPHVIRSPVEKDDTDVMLAVREGMARGFEVYIINGGLGGRLDHSLANIQILMYIAKRGARGYLLGRNMCVTVIKDSSISFKSGATGLISVFCGYGRAEGVTLTGLKYPLSNAAVTCDFPIGVSNEFTGVPAVISVLSGVLIIMWTGGVDLVES